MSLKQLFIMGISAVALAACGGGGKSGEAKAEKDEAAAEVPVVEETEETVQLTAEEALARSTAFLEKNAGAEGVTVTDSGLQFRSVVDGDGPAAAETDYVTVHYIGTLVDGTVFDSSVARDEPVTFPLQAVIPGWKEGILLMKQGGKAQFTLPPEIAYGEKGTPDGTIGPNEAINFEVELIEVIAADNTERLQALQNEARARFAAKQEALASVNGAAAVAYLKENSEKDGVKTTASGLQYRVLEEGDGEKSPTAADSVEVHYRGTLINGTVFDSSYKRGQTTTFPLGNVIRGWTEGLQLMKEGDKFEFVIPPELAYGMNPRPGGPIGPNELLIFEVELVDVKDPEPAAPAGE